MEEMVFVPSRNENTVSTDTLSVTYNIKIKRKTIVQSKFMHLVNLLNLLLDHLFQLLHIFLRFHEIMIDNELHNFN